MSTVLQAPRVEHPVVTKQRQKRDANVQLTREIHALTTDLHRRVIDNA